MRQDNNELYHYGKLGMHWGVRTSVYSKNTVGDKYTNRKKRTITRTAINLLKKDAARSNNYGNSYRKHYISNMNKISNLTERKKLLQKDSTTSKKIDTKIAKLDYDGKNAYNAAKKYLDDANNKTKLVRDIDAGKIQAGRDFVTNWTASTNVPMNFFIPNYRVERKIDFK